MFSQKILHIDDSVYINTCHLSFYSRQTECQTHIQFYNIDFEKSHWGNDIPYIIPHNLIKVSSVWKQKPNLETENLNIWGKHTYEGI